MFINSSYYCIDEYSPLYQLYFECVFYCNCVIKEMVNKQMCNCVILYIIKIFTYLSCSNFSNCLLPIINNMISTNNPLIKSVSRYVQVRPCGCHFTHTFLCLSYRLSAWILIRRRQILLTVCHTIILQAYRMNHFKADFLLSKSPERS